ncbi:MAG TPA: DUF192 domain-containing protein [Thermoanaerobaculia bacterium]|jgi:uncharacterized membrane protein (UPF0127 family)|nr:DUF192 domain-containing protein [Thermoanaerobaculia bacterium]
MRTALVLLLALSCSNPPATTSPQTATTQPAAGGPRIVFPDGSTLRLEIANDDELRAQGLMFRDHLAPDAGMLFFFPREGEYGFWMKNTRIPLDMIWIDSNHRVAHVKFNVPPCHADPCPSYPPNAQARYVLEVAGGVAQKHGIKAGDMLRFEGTDPYEVR